MKTKLLAVLLLLASNNALAATQQCAEEAINQAGKLLSFHSNGDDRAKADSTVKALPSISNPVDKSQKFLVLEVMGYIYKGTYRMRLIYYPSGNECVLMGQEILELAKL